VALDGGLQQLHPTLDLCVAVSKFSNALVQQFFALPLLLVDLGDLVAVGLLDGADDGVVVVDHVLRLLVLLGLLLHFVVLGLQLCDYRDQTLEGGHHFLEGLGEGLLFRVDQVVVAEKKL
jgi:hypothetical protein